MKKRIIKYCTYIGILGILFFSYLLFNDKAKADMNIFYPSTCLGGWNNTDKAEGKPDIGQDKAGVFDDENSASVGDIVADIFCGDFTGEIVPDSVPRALYLKLSWSAASTVVPKVEAIPEGDEEISEEVIPEEAEGDEEISEEVQEESEEEQEDEVEREPAPEEPVSFWNFLATPAHAEDFSGEEVLIVEYTLDGTAWKELGRMRADDPSYIFKIPEEGIKRWQDISKLQVRLSKISTFDVQPKIFLDGMSLEVSYEKEDVAEEFVSLSGLYIKDITSNSEDLQLHKRASPRFEEEIVIASPHVLGGMALYEASSSVPIMTTFVESESYVLQPTNFGKGIYSVILTSDPNTCASIPISDCIITSGSGGKGSFEVTSLTEASSTIDKLIQ